MRGKLLALVGVCLVPMLGASLILSSSLEAEQREDALARVGLAESAFSTELRDDIANVRVAAQLLATDPDVARELSGDDRPLLTQHIDDFTLVYPAMRVWLTDSAGRILASTDPQLRALPSGRAATSAFQGVARLQLPDGSLDPTYSFVVGRPISIGTLSLGTALASFPLDAAYLQNTKEKTGLELALRAGNEVPAATGLEDTLRQPIPVGARRVLSLPGRQTVALSAFAPAEVAPLEVVAALDLTPLVQVVAANRRARLLSLATVGVLALLVALTLSRGMTRAVAAIARVLPGVAEQRYQRVEGVATGDELEALALVYNAMIERLGQHERWRSALGCYLSPAAQEAVELGEVKLGGSTMAATVLFSDIRGFTSLSEHLAPEKVLDLLNRYFTEMVAVVSAHGGTVDKYIGDCIMAVWGPPRPKPDDAVSAVRAGLAMRERLEQLNREFEALGLPPLRTGIGIHSGPVVAGNIGAAGKDGSGARMEYTVIGDTVNLASRLEALTKELHVDFLITESTYRLVAREVRAEPLEEVAVRGRVQAVKIYRVVGRAAERAPERGALGAEASPTTG